jgi:adenylate cyclase
VLGGVRRHTLTHVARESGLDTAFLRKLMQANGRARSAPRERAYTDEDVELAKRIRYFVEAGLPRAGILEIARVLGQGMLQTTEVVRRLVGTTVMQPGDSELVLALRYVAAADALAPQMPPVMEAVFRAQLRDGIRRELITEAEREAGRLSGTREVAVAFADLVDYTRLGGRVPTEMLGQIATRLAELATSSVVTPTLVVKTIGDAVMLVSREPPAMIETLTALQAAVEAEGPEFPALRVGVAHGPATPRGGDWFGATVNLASRVADAAKPGRVYATEEVRDRAGPGREWRRSRRRHLKGVDGRTRIYSLERETSPSAT